MNIQKSFLILIIGIFLINLVSAGCPDNFECGQGIKQVFQVNNNKVDSYAYYNIISFIIVGVIFALVIIYFIYSFKRKKAVKRKIKKKPKKK